MVLLWILMFSVLGSIGAILAASWFFLLSDINQKKLVPYLVSYATGVLLAAALLGLIPNAMETTPPRLISTMVLGGILLFFIIEKSVIWRHCHNETCPVHGTIGPMILVGDAIHNATDGIVIAASFLTSIPLGIIVGLSIIAHEIPQEVGDLAILIQNKYSKKRALTLNILSSVSTIPAAIIAYYALDAIITVVPFVMAIAAASFIYIALTDLTPQLHQKMESGTSIRQILLVFLGVATILLFVSFHP